MGLCGTLRILLYITFMPFYFWVQCCDTSSNDAEAKAKILYIYPVDGEMILMCETIWTMIWMKEDDILVNGLTILTNDSRVSTNEKNLVIKDVTRADEGEYRCCEVAGMDKKTQLQRYSVIIVENMTFTGKSPEFIRATNSSDVRLWCNITGYPPPQITWYAQQGTRLEYIGIKGPLLRIANLQYDCTSKYTCIGTSSACQPINHTMTVVLEASPFVYIDVDSRNVTYHDDFVLVPRKRSNTPIKVTCSVDLVPLGNISWVVGGKWLGRTVIINGRPVKIDSERNEPHEHMPSLLPRFSASLTEYTRVELIMMITIVEDSDFEKNYTCVAENEYGYDEWTLKFLMI